MAQWKTLGAGVALSALMGTTAAFADVTAAEVWKRWSDTAVSMGQQVSVGSERREGNTLVLRDLVFSQATPEGGYSANVPELRLRERGDGSVEVTVAPEIPMQINATPTEGPATDMAVVMRTKDMRTIVAGTPEAMSYAITAPEIVLEGDAADAAAAGSAGAGGVPVKFLVTMTGNEGAYTVDSADVQMIDGKFTTDAIDFTLSGADAEAGSTFTAKGSTEDLSLTGKTRMPKGVDMQDMAAALAAGFSSTGAITYGKTGYVMDFSDAEGTGNIKSSAESATLDFSVSGDGLSYAGQGTGTQVEITAPTMPFPVSFAMQQAAFKFAMPVAKRDMAQDFGLKLDFSGVTISEALWGMFDPTAQLPRDPARLLVDITGKAKLVADFFDATAMQSGAAPGEIEAVKLTAMQLNVAGADLSGTGDVTVDNSGAAPKPVGAVNLRLVGGNTLIDKLVAMGLLPDDQAMGARMMLGLFAVPSGEDTLTSTIEFRADGGIYANGQRLQ